MKEQLTIKRTTGNDKDFKTLIAHLDHELWNELNEDQATYDQYNKIPDIKTVAVLYVNNSPVASGCFKKYNDSTVEIKRMFVEKEYRGKGLSNIVLKELEAWAIESGFKYALLETSIHFKIAQALYKNAGYKVIPNYDQYAGLEESVCMKKKLGSITIPSEFNEMSGIEYFDFEEDFIEENVRCIPMIIRFKMDKAGIKLKLSEWSKFPVEERKELAVKLCTTNDEETGYKNYLKQVVKKYTGKEATEMEIEKHPAWSKDFVPMMLDEKAKEFNWKVSIDRWKSLTELQRFALLKLCKPGHENRNFPTAMKEFKLI